SAAEQMRAARPSDEGDPLAAWPWECKPPSRHEVNRALGSPVLVAETAPAGSMSPKCPRSPPREGARQCETTAPRDAGGGTGDGIGRLVQYILCKHPGPRWRDHLDPLQGHHASAELRLLEYDLRHFSQPLRWLVRSQHGHRRIQRPRHGVRAALLPLPAI